MPGETNHANLVAQAKTEVVAAGVDITTECGVFAIVQRAVELINAQFPAEHAGVLYKDTGSMCAKKLGPGLPVEGYAMDIVCYTDGTHVDVIINAGTQNIPAWNVYGHKVDPSRYRAVPSGGSTPVPPDPNPPDYELEQRVAELEARVTVLEQQGTPTPYKIGLRAVKDGKVVSVWDQPTLIANRDNVGLGEEFILEVKEWGSVPPQK